MLVDFQTEQNWDAAVEFMVNAGDQKASSLPRNDWYRLRRSLEILKSTGSPLSSFLVPYDSFREIFNSPDANNGFDENGSSGAEISIQNILTDLDYDFLCFFLSSPRVDLYRSIDFRCEDMLSGAEGVLSEGRWLLDLGLLPNTSSATCAIGGTDRPWNIYRMSSTSGCELPGELWVFEQISASFPVIFLESQPLEEYRSKKKHMEFDLP